MNSIKMSVVAQMIMDKFYQGLAPRTAFFKKEDFLRDAILTYNTMAQDKFRAEKREAKMNTGFSFVEVSPQMLIEEHLTVKKQNKLVYVETEHPIFPFDYDSLASGLQYIDQSIGKCDAPYFVKITQQDVPAIRNAPMTPIIFYHVKGDNRIILIAKKGCYPEEVNVQYVPKVSEDSKNCVMSENFLEPVMTSVLQLYLGAKNGSLIQKANDGNPNGTPQNQSDNRLK